MEERLVRCVCSRAYLSLRRARHPRGGEPDAVLRGLADGLAALLDSAGEGVRARYRRLPGGCAGEAFALALLELCDATARELLEETGGAPGVSLALARMVQTRRPFSPAADFAGLEADFADISWLLRATGTEETPFYLHRLYADERLLGFLCGSDTPDRRLAGLAEWRFPGAEEALFYGDEIAGELQTALASDARPLLIQLCGAESSGRRYLLAQAARRAGLPLLLADWGRLAAMTASDRAEAVWAVEREARLYGGAVCLWGIAPGGGERDGCALLLREGAERLESVPLIVCTPPDHPLTARSTRCVRLIRVPPPDREARIRLWRGFHARYGLRAPLDFISAATKFRLSPGEIARAVERLARREREGLPIDEGAVAQAVYELAPPAAGGKALHAGQGFDFDDLKLPLESKQMLRHIAGHVTFRHRVFDDWGLESRYPYGRGVVALFTGQSGTGKTMAANVMAAQLGLALYRVDLSQVVDKYIGETEKRLEEIFTTAEKSNVILFFDEADAIFGKRSEVKEAKDRYANTEVSYILQRIEDYDGIVLLATNYRNNIDEAFLRRIRYVVDFPLPDPAVREEIWRSCFPPGTPARGLDFAYLAEQFEITGGVIKNIVLAAVFYAAAENRPVTMEDILRAVRIEELKKGKVLLRQDLGAYSHLFEAICAQ